MVVSQHTRFAVTGADAYFQLEGIQYEFSCIHSIVKFKIKSEIIKKLHLGRV